MNDVHTILACATFDSILDEHKAVMWGIRMLASTPSAEGLAASLRLRSGLRRADEVAFDDAEKIVEIAERMSATDGFQKIRINLLVALCSSLEHAVKAFLVDGVINRPQLQRDWEVIRTEISNTSFDDQTASERYFEVASELWNKRASRPVPAGQRLVNFVLEKCATANEPLDQKRFNVSDLNEAFTVRNAFIHNGGLPSPHLQKKGFEAGKPMMLPPELLHRYVVAMEGFSDALLNCTDRVTMDDL